MKTLIVDDHAIFRKMVHKMLPGNFEVLQAENGAQAYEIVKANPDIKLILTDHNMPKMKGLDFVLKLSKEGSLEGVSVVFLTSERDKELIKTAKDIGVDLWLAKPFKKHDLDKVLQSIAV